MHHLPDLDAQMYKGKASATSKPGSQAKKHLLHS